MAFQEEIKTEISNYIDGHIAPHSWHLERFDFIRDASLQTRLADEFISTRYIYKLLEGLSADSWLLRAQIRNQIMSYASIYEAVIHHVLFDIIGSNEQVKALREFKTRKDISIPTDKLELLQSALSHGGKTIIPTYEATGKAEISKIRFDAKANCFHQLGFISQNLRDDVIEFYEARNAIHIHAEIKKGLTYELELSKKAYLRMEPFIDQIKQNISAYT